MDSNNNYHKGHKKPYHIYTICKHRLVERLRTPDKSIHLILTDPPYNSQHLYVYETLGTEGFRMLKGGGSLLTYAPHKLAYNEVISNTTEYYYECHLIDFYVTAQEVGIAWA